jgi:NADH:ubiquinone oxidoreductase subunit 3 (subunit A)
VSWLTLLLSLILTAVIVMCGMLLAHHLLGFRSITPDTYATFECGFDGLDYNSESLDCELLFFVLIFLVFDLELVVFIYWCASPTLLSLESGSLACLLALFVTSTLHELYGRLIDSEVSTAY